MKRKLNLGKKTMSSVEIQVTSILQSIHKVEVSVESIAPVRYDHGVYFRVLYHTVNEAEIQRSQYFAHQKTRDCCDVWLESPKDFNRALGESAA
jgi:hypothetical protein